MPRCTRVSPLTDTLMFSPAGLLGVNELDDETPASAEELDDLGDDEDVAGDVLDAESDGWADAAHGVAASPTPMPRATASPPTRPMYFAYPMVIPRCPAQPRAVGRCYLIARAASKPRQSMSARLPVLTPVLPGELRSGGPPMAHA